MVCKSCGKNLANGVNMCPNCGNMSLPMNFQNNKLGANGKNAEYITEKYNMKKGVYEGKASDGKQSYLGMAIMFVIVLIIIAIAVASYLV